MRGGCWSCRGSTHIVAQSLLSPSSQNRRVPGLHAAAGQLQQKGELKERVCRRLHGSRKDESSQELTDRKQGGPRAPEEQPFSPPWLATVGWLACLLILLLLRIQSPRKESHWSGAHPLAQEVSSKGVWGDCFPGEHRPSVFIIN